MALRIDSRTYWIGLWVTVLLTALSICQPAAATEDSIERERFPALVRQIKLIDRLAEPPVPLRRNAPLPLRPRPPARDLQRIRTGIQDYLTPPRA
jgi:hypothetical protein